MDGKSAVYPLVLCTRSNLHRDVLDYYFGKCCPECGRTTIICPGCGGVIWRYPDLLGSCSRKIACPFCMGYGFATNDKQMARFQERFESQAFGLRSEKPQSEKESQELQKRLQSLKEEFLEETRCRCKRINARKEEMATPLPTSTS